MATTAENAEQVVRTYQRATAANRQTAAQQGSLVRLDPSAAEEVMITADLHGHRLNFERLLRVADLQRHPRRQLVMQEVCHGGPTYPSSAACMSHLLLEDVARLKADHRDRFHFVLGNHELAEIVDFPITKSNRMLNLVFRCGMQEMYGPAADRVREASLDFLRSCPLAVRLSNGVFVCHSAPDRVVEEGFDVSLFERSLTAADAMPAGPAFRLVWGRDFREENAAAFARLVDASVLIHGHEPCPAGYRMPNDFQIILDCCGEQATYVLLDPADEATPASVAERIRFLA